MTKKIIILVSIYLSIVLLLFITCKPCVSYTFTYDITGITTVLKDNQFIELSDYSTKNIDSVRINCELSGIEYIDKSDLAYNAFFSSAYATTTCHDYLDEYKGLVNKIKTIEITCNKDIWGIKNGQPLDTTLYGIECTGFLFEQSIDSLIHFYNFNNIAIDREGRGYGHSRFYVNFKRDTGNDFVKFSLIINFFNGDTIRSETKSIRLTNWNIDIYSNKPFVSCRFHTN